MVVRTSAESTSHSAARIGWAVPLIPAAVSGFCLSALLFYHLQIGGDTQARGLVQGFVVGLYRLTGFVPALLLALLVLVWSTIWFSTGRLVGPLRRAGRLLALAVSLSILISLQPSAVAEAQSGGGIIGDYLATRLQSALGYVPSTLLAAIASLMSLLLATDMLFRRYFESIARTPAPVAPSDEAGVEAEAVREMQGLRLEAGAPAAVPAPGGATTAAPETAPEPVELNEPVTAPAMEVEVPEVGLDLSEGVELAEEVALAEALEIPESAVAEPAFEQQVAEEPVEEPAPVAEEVFVPVRRVEFVEVETEEEVEEPALEEPEVEEPEVEETELEAEAAEEDAEEAEDEDEYEYEEVDCEEEEEPEEADGEEEEEYEYEEVEIDADEAEEDAEEEAEDDEEEEYEYEEVEIEADEDEAEEEEEAEEDAEDDEEYEYEEVEYEEGEEPEEDEEEEEYEEVELDDGGEVEPAGEALEAAPNGVERVVEIPRPAASAAAGAASSRQGTLFAQASEDTDLLEEATELVLNAQRASAVFLQRRLRVGYEEALDLMDALRRRGVVGGDPGETHGEVLVESEA